MRKKLNPQQLSVFVAIILIKLWFPSQPHKNVNYRVTFSEWVRIPTLPYIILHAQAADSLH